MDNVDNFPGIKGWIGSRKIWKNIVGNVGDDGAAAQKRRLGRFLFSCSVNDYEALLKNQAKSIKEKSKETDITFHIVTGLAGGTGSGSIVDTIAQTRKHFPPNISSGLSYNIIVYCQIPEHSPLPNWDKGNYHANGYAALQEVNAMKVHSFIPHDVSGEFEKITYDGDSIFNSCFLYTNANENGITVDTEKELPTIISDLLHHYIFLPIDDTVRAFKDCFSTENVDPKDEYDENAEATENRIPVRSKAFKSFGIKRIINPEDEIKEYLTYTLAEQALNQFKYNNWSDDFGYRDEIKNEDYYSLVNNEGFLKRVLLDDIHLTLSAGILPGEIEQKWKTIQDDWSSIIPLLSQTAWNNNEAHALNELAKLCQDRFDKHFRKIGVPDFYKLKRKAKKDHAVEILQNIEKHLFDEWHSGNRSLYDIGKIIETIDEYIATNLKGFDSKIIAKEKKLEDLNKLKAANEQSWSNTGFLSSLAGKKKNLYQSQTTVLQTIYIVKTELEGMEFAKELLKELTIGANEMRNEITRLTERFDVVTKFAKEAIATRCQDNSEKDINFSSSIIRYYNPTSVRHFSDVLRKDSDLQKRQSAAVRNRIVDNCGTDHSFAQLVERMNEEVLTSILEDICKSTAIESHNEITQGKSSAIIGKNIIEQLSEKFGSSDQKEALDEFSRNVIRSAGVFLTFDNSEINRAIPNNKNPRPGTNIMFRSVLISMPPAAGKESFIKKLSDSFRANIEGAKTIYFDYKSDKRNEITIISLTYCFPLRMVNDIKLLKTKYDGLLTGEQKEINQLVLHLEGDGSQYPPIYVEKYNPEKYLGTLLLATALKMIQYQDKCDNTGKKAFCISKNDPDGFPLPPVVICDKISGLHETEISLSEMKHIVNDVNNALMTDYLHVTKREELVKEMVALANTILKECNNNLTSSTYKKYLEAIKQENAKLRK